MWFAKDFVNKIKNSSTRFKQSIPAKSAYFIKSNFSEKQIEADVSGFFGWISKGSPFRLIDIDEQLTGADKKFYDSGFAFFMQFKVSNGLKSIDKIPSSKRKNRSALEDIREFRKEHALQDDPSLFFGLRKMAKTANDFQHNILLKYSNRHNSHAFYVAPLHLDKEAYYNCLFDSVNRFSLRPYFYRCYRLIHPNWTSHVGHVPFLKEHISIIPHERVTTHKHCYSFSPTGHDIGWHSPELVSDRPSRLSDVMSKEIASCIDDYRFISLDELPKILEIDTDDIEIDDEDPIERIQRWGKRLYLNNGISIYLLLGNRKYIDLYKAGRINV